MIMNNAEILLSRIQDVSTFKELLQEHNKQSHLPPHEKPLRINFSDTDDIRLNLVSLDKIAIRVCKNVGNNLIDKSGYDIMDKAFVRECLLEAINANRTAILQSMIDCMCEQIKVDYDILWQQMHQLGESMAENIDKCLCTEEKEIVTKVLTNKYAENEEMSATQAEKRC